MRKRIPPFFTFLVSHYLLGIFCFFIFRGLLFFTYDLEHGIDDENFLLIKKGFLIGLQFDTVVMGYILALPFLVLAISSFTKPSTRTYGFTQLFIVLIMGLAFFISAADIPYFNYNFSRLSAVIFAWSSDSKIIVSMVMEETSYFLYFFVFILFIVAYAVVSRFFLKRFKRSMGDFTYSIITKIGFAFLGLFLIFFAVRGRINSPIKITHSFFCNNAFYNQLGLNPSFTLLKSLKQDNAIKVMDYNEAVSNVSSYFNISDTSILHSPIARKIKSVKKPLKKNIVLVLMESMSAHKMKRYGNTQNLSPFLDSLADASYCFDNIYSAGFHTCDGIFSTLYSYPTILRERPMSALNPSYFPSIPKVLKEAGYYNIYFTTHSQTFDNVGFFLPKNNIDKIVSQKDYDPKKVQNTFGVPDHILFEYALTTLDDLDKKESPFFATLMTVSDHGPYIIPENIDFMPKSTTLKTQIVEYADWSISQFMQQAKTKVWYKNTVFVFVADHGVIMNNNNYETPLSLHHIPYIVFSGDSSFVQPKSFSQFGGQIDVLPTLMGLLNFSYINSTFGIDLLRNKRPYAYFSTDNKFGCIGTDFYYIYKLGGKELLYDLKSGRTENVIKQHPQKAKSMKKYVLSMIQASKKVRLSLDTNN